MPDNHNHSVTEQLFALRHGEDQQRGDAANELRRRYQALVVRTARLRLTQRGLDLAAVETLCSSVWCDFVAESARSVPPDRGELARWLMKKSGEKADERLRDAAYHTVDCDVETLDRTDPGQADHFVAAARIHWLLQELAGHVDEVRYEVFLRCHAGQTQVFIASQMGTTDRTVRNYWADVRKVSERLLRSYDGE